MYVTPFIKTRVGNIPLAITTYFETGQVSDSATIRLALWHASTFVFINNPLFGVGPGNFDAAKLPYIEAGLLPNIIVDLIVPIASFLIPCMSLAYLAP